jgi:hypothetical protein
LDDGLFAVQKKFEEELKEYSMAEVYELIEEIKHFQKMKKIIVLKVSKNFKN